MRTIKLTGELGKRFGTVHRMDIRTPAEAIRALSVNFPEFHKELLTSHEKNVGYQVVNGSFEIDIDGIHEPAAAVIIIAPVIMGSGAVARIIIGSALVAGGAALIVASEGAGSPVGSFLISAGVGLALGGVIELLSPHPKISSPEENPGNKPSYLFNGPVNTVNQGHPVPVGYGRLRVGGGVVSGGISVEQIMAGFKRVQVEKTVTINANHSQTAYATTPPSNYFRKELISYDPYHFGTGSGMGQWTWRFWYYDTVLIPVTI